ncbi:universal stress protein [Flavobacterium cellulosilyticum]|uniref:Universal stress protein n=1 Tax=Flavobacterium cellulosilyticum TaxID=2541731 RepID=A0A4R5C230_9FLAO|nr:universal stress protein [Flavobacterium cellulosilyticum]TDD93661.1 universal stress protein [Flavobacterium cellulosilyticum]
MKRILFPTDFSEVATNAFSYALEFANLIEGEVIVLHSFDLIPMDNQFFPENFTELYDSIELANFEQFKEEIPKLRQIMEKRNYEHIKMTHRLMEGDLFTNIKKSILEDKIDYIVMGTSAEREWEALFAGSNSGSVILGLNVPMICVPMGVQFKKFKKIGYINHYTPNDEKALYSLLDIAKKANAKIKSLYVKTSNSDIDTEYIEKWEAEFKQEPIAFCMIQSEDIKAVELDFISKQEIDILTILTYKSSLFENMFVPNYSKKTESEIQIPILVIHA